MKQISVELSNYEVPHIWGGARCCEPQEQEQSWSPVIYHGFVLRHTVPLPGAPTPSPSRAYTVNTIQNETNSRAVSYGQTEFDTYLGVFYSGAVLLPIQ
jgi:hypothetical protein